MTLASPPTETLRHLQDRLRANDVPWFLDRYRCGDLAWLRDHVPPGAYDEMGERIDAGDLDWLRLRLAGLPQFTQSGLAAAALAVDGAHLGAAAAAAGSIKGVGIAAADARVAPRKRGVWIVGALLLGAALSAGFLAWLNRDATTSPDTSVSVLTVAAAVSPDSAPADTGTSVDTTTVVSAIETTTPTGSVKAPAAIGDVLATLKAAGSFSTLVAAVENIEMSASLESPGAFTMFAPTDTAFAALPPGVLDALLKPENREVLAKVLGYHVLRNAGKLTAGAVKDGSVVTVEGSSIEATHVDGRLVVNGVNVTTADVAASNGLVHVIDAVLIPPSVDVPSLLGDVPATVSDTTLPSAGDVTATNAAGDAVSESLTVYFASGSAALDADAQTKIDGAAITLAGLPTGATVDLVGHASATGNATFNQQLSERRAAAVEIALKAKLGEKVSGITFTTSAKGDAEPVADQASSRRVTIEIKG
jgi:uncharacterized surface protein with fasciclin (FAS1) repeats